nr:HD domain-containing phosphohydrolase [Desulfurispora thermophila]
MPEVEYIRILAEQKKEIERLTRELEIIFHSTQDAMFLVRVEDDGSFRYLRNNAAHQRATGFSQADLQGKTPGEVVGRELGAVLQANYQRCVDARVPITYEESLTLPAGQRYWLTSLTPVLENGKVQYLVGSRKDITEQKRQEKAKEDLSQQLRAMFDEHAAVMLLIEPVSGRIVDANLAACSFYGYSREEMLRLQIQDINMLPREEVAKKLRAAWQQKQHHFLFPHRVKSGEIRLVDVYSSPIVRGQERLLFSIIFDVTEREKYKEELCYLSYHDPLTGLYNRRFMEEEIKRLDTAHCLPLSVIMGDVNGLKLTNDVFGHAMGDELLKNAATIVKKSCRQEDIIARWGGDEFLLLLPRTSARRAEAIITRIKSGCEQYRAGSVQLSMALGYAVKMSTEENLTQTIKEAEKWMYHRKLLEGKSYRHSIINALLTTLAAKSMETEEHAARLKKHCLAVGRALGLAARELDELALFAVLHDIGKVGIKESILQKQGPLTREEWEEMKKHPEVGYRITQNATELASVAEYILYHHERWDGQGYPRGLRGEEIPLLCRILAVADAYDAMTSNRPYRRAMSRAEAVAEIARNRGTQFDPRVVDVFLRYLAAVQDEPAGAGS